MRELLEYDKKRMIRRMQNLKENEMIMSIRTLWPEELLERKVAQIMPDTTATSNTTTRLAKTVMMKLDQNNLQIPVGWKGWWNMVEAEAKRIRKMNEKRWLEESMRSKANAMKEMFIKRMQGDQKDGKLESRTWVKAMRKTERSNLLELNPMKSLESPSKSYIKKSISRETPTKSPSVKRKYSTKLQGASMNHVNKKFRSLQMFWEDKKSTSSTTKSNTQFVNNTHTHTQTKTLTTILAGPSGGNRVVTEDISTWRQIMEDQYKPEGNPEASDVSELCK